MSISKDLYDRPLNVFHPGQHEKYAIIRAIPHYMMENEGYVREIREKVVREAFNTVAEKTLHENGANIKTVLHEFDQFEEYFPVRKIGAVVLVSHPHDYVAKMIPIEAPYQYTPKIYHCFWCGAESPLDDRFHSGTCENCGGPKLPE